MVTCPVTMIASTSSERLKDRLLNDERGDPFPHASACKRAYATPPAIGDDYARPRRCPTPGGAPQRTAFSSQVVRIVDRRQEIHR
jgi:hypothetical protein